MRRAVRVAGPAAAVSALSLVAWLILGTRPLFYLAVLLTSYTAIMAPLVLRANRSVTASRRLKQSVVQMKSQDTITTTLEGLSPRSPLSIQLDVLLPPYIIRGSGIRQGLSWVQEFNVNRRGIYQVGECIVTLSDPLRLFRLSKRMPADLELTVFPTVIPLEKLRIALTSPLDGQRVKFAPNYDVSQMAGVRPYASDPMSRIHWKMSAHHGELVVKEFAPSASKTIVVLLNLTLRREPSFTMETFEDYMTMVAASILQHAHDRKLPFGVTILGSDELGAHRYSRDATHLFACYRLLANARATMDRNSERTSLLDFLHREHDRIPPRSQLFLLQHELSEEEISALLRMQGRFSRISICLFPYGSFLLYGERPVPYFMPDVQQITRLKKTQSILRDAGVDLSIIGLNDTLAALGEV